MTTRRQVLGLLGAGGAGLVAGAGGAVAVTADDGQEATPRAVVPHTISPYGKHQPGVAAPTPRAVRLLALDLRPDVDQESLGRLMRLWTGDIEAAAAGRPAPGDTAADLAQDNLDLTLTVGWGPGVFELPGMGPARPGGLRRVPPMDHDRLRPQWSGGDLLLLAQAADDTTLAHVLRRMLLDAAPFATLRWEQVGSWRGLDRDHQPTTGRNLFGQIDGTANPQPGGPLFDRTVWAAEPDWFAGGTTLVVRRIAMALDTWDELIRDDQERAIGKDLRDGKALKDQPADSHVALSRPDTNAGARIFRKGANYTVTDGGRRESGLIFCSFQADVDRQFTRIQRSLDRADRLNTWTTAIGSAEFAVLPGFEKGGWLGERVLA